MELLSTDGIFISGISCKVIELGKAVTCFPTAAAKPSSHGLRAVVEDSQDSDPDPLTDLEPEHDIPLDTEQPEVFEELFGYKRKAGRPPGANAATKAKAPVQREIPDSGLAHKTDGRTKAGKAARVSSRATFTVTQSDIGIKDMLAQGLFHPGQQNVTAVCKGVTCTASLSSDGEILYDGHVFPTPGAFSHFVKIKHGHNRPGGDGWRYVAVDGVSLDEWRCRMLGLAVVPAAKPGRPTLSSSQARDGQRTKRLSLGLSIESRKTGPPEAPPLPASEGTGDPKAEAAPTKRSNWVQCADCCTWRVVPDKEWDLIGTADDHEWFCKDATWDVTQHEPHTPVCGQP